MVKKTYKKLRIQQVGGFVILALPILHAPGFVYFYCLFSINFFFVCLSLFRSIGYVRISPYFFRLEKLFIIIFVRYSFPSCLPLSFSAAHCILLGIERSDEILINNKPMQMKNYSSYLQIVHCKLIFKCLPAM